MDNQKQKNKKIAIIILGICVIAVIGIIIKKIPKTQNISNESSLSKEKQKIIQSIRESMVSQPTLTEQQKAEAIENIKSNNTTTSSSLTSEEKDQIIENIKRDY